MLKFAIIGAGAGGQSMAAILTDKGYTTRLYDIDKEKIHRLQELDTIKVTGVIECEAKPAVITDSIEEVMTDVDVVMIVSTTDAHGSIAAQIKPYLKDGQIVMLNPGHCGGALEIANVLRDENGCGIACSRRQNSMPSYTFVSTGFGCTPPIKQYSIPASCKDCFTLSSKPLRTTEPPPYTIITFRAPCFRASAPTCISVALPNTNSVGL